MGYHGPAAHVAPSARGAFIWQARLLMGSQPVAGGLLQGFVLLIGSHVPGPQTAFSLWLARLDLQVLVVSLRRTRTPRVEAPRTGSIEQDASRRS